MITGDKLTKENQAEINQNLSFFNTFLLIFALVALFVGCVHHLQHLLHHRGAAHEGDGPPAAAIGASGRQVIASVLGSRRSSWGSLTSAAAAPRSAIVLAAG